MESTPIEALSEAVKTGNEIIVIIIGVVVVLLAMISFLGLFMLRSQNATQDTQHHVTAAQEKLMEFALQKLARTYVDPKLAEERERCQRELEEERDARQREHQECDKRISALEVRLASLVPTNGSAI